MNLLQVFTIHAVAFLIVPCKVVDITLTFLLFNGQGLRFYGCFQNINAVRVILVVVVFEENPPEEIWEFKSGE